MAQRWWWRRAVLALRCGVQGGVVLWNDGVKPDLLPFGVVCYRLCVCAGFTEDLSVSAFRAFLRPR